VRQRLDWLLCLLQDIVDYLGNEVLVRVSCRLQATRSNNREVLALLHPRRAQRARVVLDCCGVVVRLVHTNLGLSYLIAHVLHDPPPPTSTALY
jgi:hypothetical protein